MHESVERLVARLEEVRARTLRLVESVSDDDFARSIDGAAQPIAWDLLHVANHEERWLSRVVRGGAPLDPALERALDPARVPRERRAGLSYPDRASTLRYVARVRRATLEMLAGLDSSRPEPLLEGGLLVGLVAEHEERHQEALLETAARLEPGHYVPPERRAFESAPVRAESTPGTVSSSATIVIPEGKCVLGARAGSFARDDEGPEHEAFVGAFELDRRPASELDFLESVEAGLYDEPRHWSRDGWEWRTRNGVRLPNGWVASGGRVRARSYDLTRALDGDRPVSGLSWFEADAYARFRGKRLPTESEWEKAARWGGRERPWGDAAWSTARANLDQLGFDTAPASSLRAGASALGLEQLLGDVWEWTASDYELYSEFEAFPVRERARQGSHKGAKVLRGGSWATRPRVARATFRRSLPPGSRQAFAGVRCATSVN